MENFKLKEAFYEAKLKDNSKTQKELAELLYPESKPNTQRANVNNLFNSERATVKPRWVSIICEYCECTPEFLFGMNQKTKK